jgi:hypothetical protein
MKKIVLMFAAAAIAATAAIASAEAKPGGPGIGKGPGMGNPGINPGILKPGFNPGNPGGPKPGCCGGWNPDKHWGGHWGGGIGVGLVSSYATGGDCYYVRKRVYVDGIGVVSKRQLVCE